jgi:predicted Zn-dependent protease with MMP-like domain
MDYSRPAACPETQAVEPSFEDLVDDALDELPSAFRDHLRGVEVLIQDEPTAEQLRAVRVARGHTLFGLYHGVPLTARASAPPQFPDRIIIFRGPLLRRYRHAAEIREQVRRTVLHELAHHFGISDDRLRELGAY